MSRDTINRLKDETLWCGYYLTNAQKVELLNQTHNQFVLAKHDRLRPFQLVELVRNMIKN